LLYWSLKAAMIVDEGGVQPSEKFVEEVQEYFLQQTKNLHNREARHAPGGQPCHN
jgi:hypothetical protein